MQSTDRAAATQAQPLQLPVEAQRQELREKLESLMQERVLARVYIAEQPHLQADRAQLEARLPVLEEQIKLVEFQLQGLPPTPGTPVPSTSVSPAWPTLPALSNEYVLLGSLLMLVTLLPLSIAFARRVWRRSEAAPDRLSPELEDRLQRMQTAIESVAVEVERIGEGQRYVTGLLNAGLGSPAREALPAMPDVAARRDASRAVTPH